MSLIVCLSTPLFDDEADEFAGDEDFFYEVLAFDVLDDFGVGFGGGQDGFFGGVGGDLDDGAEFAVDLDGNLDGVFD